MPENIRELRRKLADLSNTY